MKHNSRYLDERRKMKLGGAKPAEVKREKKLSQAAWYEVQATEAPKKCENCGKLLAATIAFHPRAHICHIIPKTAEGGCPSVATHPLNRWFGCKECHDNYDKWTAEKHYDKIQDMKVLPVIQARAAKFIDEVFESEKRRIPDFLL